MSNYLDKHQKLIELFGNLSWEIQDIDTSEISESHHRELIRELIYKRFKELNVSRSDNDKE